MSSRAMPSTLRLFSPSLPQIVPDLSVTRDELPHSFCPGAPELPRVWLAASDATASPTSCRETLKSGISRVGSSGGLLRSYRAAALHGAGRTPMDRGRFSLLRAGAGRCHL